MTDQATFGIAITASDKTAKGRKSAEKGFSDTAKRASTFGEKRAKESEQAYVKSAKTIGRTFEKTEQAAAKLFGGRSITGGLASKLGGLRSIASGLGEGFGEASTAGGALEVTIGAVGAAAAGAVAVLGVAAYAAFSLSDKWAKSAATIGRTAEIIGVGTKAMQEFALAGERVGVDRGAATGALGGLSQTLNDARYGRNADAVALLARMGVQMKTKADGTVDVEGMLPQLADALTRQNSSGRRTAARILGIGEGALPIFTQGGKSLSSEMADTDERGAVLTDDDVRLGKKLQRRDVIGSQMKEQFTNAASRKIAHGVEWVGDKVIGGARSFSDSVHNDFVPAARLSDKAADRMEGAAARIEESQAPKVVPGLTREAILAAQAAERKYGVPAAITLGQYGLESSYGKHMPAGSNNPFGIKARAGEPFVLARTREEDRAGRSYYINAKFRKFASLEEAFDAHAKLLMGSRYAGARAALPDEDAYADKLTGVYATDHHYGQKLQSLIHRNGLDRYDNGGGVDPIPVTVDVHLHGGHPGDHVRVKAGKAAAPAVSHSFAPAYIPVHGG